MPAGCHDPSCAPPPAGTGGSKAGARRKIKKILNDIGKGYTSSPRKANEGRPSQILMHPGLSAAAVPKKNGYGHYKGSIGGRSPSLKWPHLYDLLRSKGYDKEKAARISNSRIGMRKHGKLRGLSYKNADNPRALAAVKRTYDRKVARRSVRASAMALVAACHSAACAPPPAGTGGSLPGGSGGGSSSSVDIDKLLADNPQREGESIFEYQARVVAGLDSVTQSDVLFQTRETYPRCEEVAQATLRWCEMKGLPKPDLEAIARTPVDLAEAHEVGRWFEQAPDASADPKVQAAYADFKRQNEEMWQFMTGPESEGGMGLKVEFTTEVDPYPTAEAQARDITENKRVVIESGLGGQHSATMTTDEYDRFRAVHDVFGHAVIGGGFDRHGEYQAWLIHAAMYTGAGRDAMSTEYHGVNSAQWAGDPGSPGTGKSVLLPEKWSNPPWDRKGLTASASAAIAKARASAIVKALKLKPGDAARLDPMPWHRH